MYNLFAYKILSEVFDIIVIDFHTHAFPDVLAERAINRLAGPIGLSPQTDGTVGGLLSAMNSWNIAESVICNIATGPHQTDSIIKFASDTASAHDRLHPLASIHPLYPDIEGAIKTISESGIPGIKLHPDFMGYTIDDSVFDPIFAMAEESGLFIITHAGVDASYPQQVNATPKMLKRIIMRYPNLTLIAAHFGGNLMWDEVLSELCGERIWFDTSLACAEGADPTILRQILLLHDPDLILFGSDAPWCAADENIRFLESFNLPDPMYDKIFESNARRLLKSRCKQCTDPM